MLLEEVGMQYKRNESFRLALYPPIELAFRILSSEQANSGQGHFFGKILDISPRGIKMYADVQLSDIEIRLCQLECQFVLDTQMIRAYGKVIWCKLSSGGYNYGVQFIGESSLDDLIISELKSRRKKEVLEAKQGLNSQK